MKPTYIPDFVPLLCGQPLADWIDSLPWLQETPARRECFMTPAGGTPYTYSKGIYARTYRSIPMDAIVADIMTAINAGGHGYALNGCFLNLYDNERNALGWHSDDFPGMDHDQPVAVVSFGQVREIWWQPLGAKGVVPTEQRQALGGGSLFIMPPGFQQAFEHKIPKGDRNMSRRVSLTFRAFKETP